MKARKRRPRTPRTLSIVSAVAYPELPDQQGVSVCVPGAYATGIDTDGDGTADVTAQDGETAVKGSLVIDYEAQITSENGQTYTAATAQTENGSAEEATGTDISSWVNADDIQAVSFTLADAASYRTAGASKATPGFDVIDYGQEDYAFGSSAKDARHFDSYLLKILEEHADELSGLFNQG